MVFKYQKPSNYEVASNLSMQKAVMFSRVNNNKDEHLSINQYNSRPMRCLVQNLNFYIKTL